MLFATEVQVMRQKYLGLIKLFLILLGVMKLQIKKPYYKCYY